MNPDVLDHLADALRAWDTDDVRAAAEAEANLVDYQACTDAGPDELRRVRGSCVAYAHRAESLSATDLSGLFARLAAQGFDVADCTVAVQVFAEFVGDQLEGGDDD